MTVSPVRFGWAYLVHGTAADRQQAWQDADAEAQQQGVALDFMPDVDEDTDLYVSEGDVATAQQHQSEIARFFAIRKQTLDDAKAALGKALKSSGHIAQADKDALVQYQAVVANDRLNPVLDTVQSLWGIQVDPYNSLQGPVPATDISNGYCDVATGY